MWFAATLASSLLYWGKGKSGKNLENENNCLKLLLLMLLFIEWEAQNCWGEGMLLDRLFSQHQSSCKRERKVDWIRSGAKHSDSRKQRPLPISIRLMKKLPQRKNRLENGIYHQNGILFPQTASFVPKWQFLSQRWQIAEAAHTMSRH